MTKFQDTQANDRVIKRIRREVAENIPFFGAATSLYPGSFLFLLRVSEESTYLIIWTKHFLVFLAWQLIYLLVSLRGILEREKKKIIAVRSETSRRQQHFRGKN